MRVLYVYNEKHNYIVLESVLIHNGPIGTYIDAEKGTLLAIEADFK